MIIAKKEVVEIAHKLATSYNKKCQHIHGHSYHFEFYFESKTACALNEDGVVADFNVLKEIYKPILDNWDHSLLVSMYDDVFMNTLVQQMIHNGQCLRICNFNPTAENMAYYLAGAVNKEINKYKKYSRVKIVKVVVRETETSYAEWTENNGFVYADKLSIISHNSHDCYLPKEKSLF